MPTFKIIYESGEEKNIPVEQKEKIPELYRTVNREGISEMYYIDEDGEHEITEVDTDATANAIKYRKKAAPDNDAA